jgi:hypothetical protein
MQLPRLKFLHLVAGTTALPAVSRIAYDSGLTQGLRRLLPIRCRRNNERFGGHASYESYTRNSP